MQRLDVQPNTAMGHSNMAQGYGCVTERRKHIPVIGPNGKLLVVGAGPDPMEVSTGKILFGSNRIQGWASGIPTDSEDTLRFAEMTGVRPMIEKYPLEKVNEAYARVISGKVQFRVVLTML